MAEQLGRSDSSGFLADTTYNLDRWLRSRQEPVPEPPELFLLSRAEALFEAVAEGGFRRLFRPRLQPVEVARALARAMTDHRVVGTSSLDVPTHYIAHLSPADFERFLPFQGTLERDLAAYLDRSDASGTSPDAQPPR